jgi:hypothetical protein
MLIKVNVKTINKDKLKLIIDYYNSKKSTDDEPLELIDNGFKIQLSYMKDQFGDHDKMCKQVQWNKGCLSSNSYISFKYDESLLLFASLTHVLGVQNVTIIK